MAQDIEWTTSSYFQSSLTFDLMTSKSIENIYTLQGTSVPKLVSVRQKVLMIWLSNIIRTLFCQYLLCPEQFDLWPFNDNKVIHVSVMSTCVPCMPSVKQMVLKVMASKSTSLNLPVNVHCSLTLDLWTFKIIRSHLHITDYSVLSLMSVKQRILEVLVEQHFVYNIVNVLSSLTNIDIVSSKSISLIRSTSATSL